MPLAMTTPGSTAMTTGLIVMLFSVSAGMHFGGYGLLLCFVGVLVGASVVAICMAEELAPIVLVVSGCARALAASVCRNTAVVGLVMASCAFRVVSGEEDPVLCFGMFTLLLLAIILVNIGARASESTLTGNQSITAATAATTTAAVIEPRSSS